MALKSQIIVHEGQIQTKGFTDQNSLVKALAENPDTLSTSITFLMGNFTKQFPLLMLTEGQGMNPMRQEVGTIQYSYPVMGKRKTTESVAGSPYSGGDTPGIGNSDMFVDFPTNWFPDQAQLRTPSGVQVSVRGREKSSRSAGWTYRVKAFNPDPSFSLPLSDFATNAVWGRVGGSAVTASMSVGNTNPTQTPGKRKNQISIIRESYHLAGNISNKVVEFQLWTNNGPTSYWIDFEEYMHMMAFKTYKEQHLWTSIYTRDANGYNPLFNEALNQEIPVGAGLMQQIPNSQSYSKLSDKLIRTILGDLFRGVPDTGKMDVILYCGHGFRDEFDEAMKGTTLFSKVAPNTSAHFVKSVGGNLTFGGYFTSYQHIDGHIVTLQDLPMLNMGAYADVSGRHPVTGYPMSSYEGYFVDQSTYDGIPNLRYISEKGRSEIRGLEQGMTLVKGSSYGDYNGNSKYLSLATEQDKSSIHFLGTCGIQLMRDTHSFKLFCNAA